LYGQYADEQEALEGRKVRNILTKPLHNLFHGEKSAKKFKQDIGVLVREEASLKEAFRKATECFSDDVLDRV
jgi:hypothetical protein